jgi:hypothetical protein
LHDEISFFEVHTVNIRHTSFAHDRIVDYRYTEKRIADSEVPTLELHIDLGGMGWSERSDGLEFLSALTNYMDKIGLPARRVVVVPAF